MLANQNGQPAYIPPLGISFLTPIYDFWMEILGYNDSYRTLAKNLLSLNGKERVLDVGCGTGTLTVEIKERYPKTKIVGIDPDPQALKIANKKAEKVGAKNIVFKRGYAQKLPLSSNHYDAVISSLTFHHLTLSGKKDALKEIFRLLKKGGKLLIVDHWPRKKNVLDFFWHRISGFFDDAKTMSDNRFLPKLMAANGLPVENSISLGRLHFLLARKP